MTSDEQRPDEETPLLQVKPKTPLPWGQLSLVFIALVAEPISSAYIFPFINQLIAELGVTGGDDRKVGYYAGLIESLFFATQALMAWQWSRLSDFIGRRPLILFGLLGLSASNFAFGLSRTLPTLILRQSTEGMPSRCIAGFLNGNIGVMRSMMADLTDHTNMARVFTLMAPIFSIGVTIAPLYGGALVKPQERWPHVFLSSFWAAYPYFLPSMVSGCFTLSTFFICAIFMKESLPSKASKASRSESSTVENTPGDSPTDEARPLPISTLLKNDFVRVLIVNYALLGLLFLGLLVLRPLFYSSPIEIGGLAFPPSIIGTFLAISGIADGSIQALFAARLIERFGPKKVIRLSLRCFYPVILLFPIMSIIVTVQGKAGPVVWVLMVVQLICMVLADLAIPVVHIYVSRVSPDRRSLGSVNGLCQSFTSVARSIAPVATTSLFAVSKEYNVLGGNLVYVVLVALVTVLIVLSRRLPDLRDEEQAR